MYFFIDMNEEKWSKEVIDNLLIDRTTEDNIIWATDDYDKLGSFYHKKSPIISELITDSNINIIQPRILKSKQNQNIRTKEKAEVFTPSWLCNEQNNLIDEVWFGKKDIFNKSIGKKWVVNDTRIKFPNDKTWRDYVDEKRIEISCGEAPYLVSRYDTVTGEPIEIKNRIGLLDRKMRVINENVRNEMEWIKWTIRAFQSIYGFELQGDSLFLARKNLLISFIDYLKDRFNRMATDKELLEISKIISWNIWQMDGLTLTIPFEIRKESSKQISFFDEEENSSSVYCVIKDWRSNKKVKFIDLIEEE